MAEKQKELITKTRKLESTKFVFFRVFVIEKFVNKIEKFTPKTPSWHPPDYSKIRYSHQASLIEEP